jgi:hypothetical protein
MPQSLLEQVEHHRKEIKHEVLTYGLSELVTMYRAEPREIIVQPDWQRLFRWSREQQSAFIESLILEVPVPPLFFFEAEDGRWELLDGLQRLSTIIKFMGVDNDVPVEFQGGANNDAEWHENTRNDVASPLQLVAPEYLTALDGFAFARLPTPLKLNLKRARLQIYVLKRETHRMYKYEVFKRLNRGGSALEEQELRNCAVRLIDDQFPNFLRQAGGDAGFRQALSISDDEIRQSYSDELALRFFTMKNNATHFRHDVGDLLTSYMEQVARRELDFDYDCEKELFRRTWGVMNRAVQDGTAFRARRRDGGLTGTFSPTLFELRSLAVAFNIDAAEGLQDDDLGNRLEELLTRAQEAGLLGSGSNSKKKTLGRVEMARTWLQRGAPAESPP